MVHLIFTIQNHLSSIEDGILPDIRYFVLMFGLQLIHRQLSWLKITQILRHIRVLLVQLS